MEQFISFLKKAKNNTYASNTAIKVASTRLGSKDYEYSDGEWVYHDTYFGGLYFIGEEVVYYQNKPFWAMNYNGFTLDKSLTESEIDKSLRGALSQEVTDIIPVRGPNEYKIENLVYKNNVKGDIDRFEGREEIYKDSNLVYYAIYHGGLIK